MSIIDSFDNKSKALIDLASFLEPKKYGDVCIVSFSIQVKEMFLERYEHEIVGMTKTANGVIDIFRFEVDGKPLLFYMSPIGSACAGCVMHEIHYFSGASKFVVYGSCGILDEEKCAGKLIVPTNSYRDEGLSYHYMPPADYVRIKNAERVAEIFDSHGYPYVMGNSWTTDAIYMETVDKANARRNEGCISVEMESSGLQALCDYYGYELYTFFFGADLLSDDSWDKANLGNDLEFETQKETFRIAVDVAIAL